MTNEVDAEDWGAWARSRIRNAGDNREHVKGMAQLADRLDEAIRLLERCYDERFEDEVAAFIVKVRP